METLPLLPHPSTPCGFIDCFHGSAGLDGDGCLRLVYQLQGHLESLRVPAMNPAPQRRDGLWQHTCFEAFLGMGDGPAYLELNFSASGDWAAYRFDDYRQGMRPLQNTSPPRIAVRRGPSQLELRMELPLDLQALGVAASPLTLGMTAVLESLDGGLSYWSCRHPGDKPDFHHPQGMAMRLPVVDHPSLNKQHPA